MTRLAALALYLSALSFAVFPEAGPSPAESPRMVRVEGGTFIQGSAEAQYAANERIHSSSVSSYFIAETETTQKLWNSIMGSNPSKFRGSDRPVDSVSWLDAVRFCNALSVRDGLEPPYSIDGRSVTWNRSANGYRLPTEAEWEYAARGGSLASSSESPLNRSPYSGGTEADAVAWFDRNSAKSTQPVGKKAPNELGVYDMSGNVWEWCWDWYGEYPRDAVVDYDGVSGSSVLKVLRGGAWFTPANLLRVTYRYWNAPTFKANSVGFRLARNDGPGDEAAAEVERFSKSLPSGVNIDLFQILSVPESEKKR